MLLEKQTPCNEECKKYCSAECLTGIENIHKTTLWMMFDTTACILSVPLFLKADLLILHHKLKFEHPEM